MHNFRMFVAAAVLTVVGVAGNAMEHDINQLQARLAAQEARMSEQDARMNDLQAKLNSAYGRSGAGNPEGIISLRKNATVTVGGLVTAKHIHTNAKGKSRFRYDDANEGYVREAGNDRLRTMERHKVSSLELGDAEVHVQIDVNEHFEAFINMDLHNTDEASGAIADTYYVHWKNVCNSGFGLRVGRDALVFGEEGVGELGSYAAGSGDALGEMDWASTGFQTSHPAGLIAASAIPAHNGWDVSGVTQITPYWEGLDGKLSVELSLMNHVYDDGPALWSGDGMYERTRNGVRKVRSRNYGIGTMSARVGYQPIEDLKFTLSFANYRSNGDPSGNDNVHGKNNTVFGLAASWRPACFNRLNMWGQWIHGNTVYFHRGMKSDAVNFGLSFDLMENLTWFAQGDYLRTSYKYGGVNDRGTAWAFYTGMQYSLPYGVSFEAGWKHERVTYKDKVAGQTTGKITGNTIYGMLGFEF